MTIIIPTKLAHPEQAAGTPTMESTGRCIQGVCDVALVYNFNSKFMVRSGILPSAFNKNNIYLLHVELEYNHGRYNNYDISPFCQVILVMCDTSEALYRDAPSFVVVMCNIYRIS